MKFHEFNFDLARELEWIAEKRTIVAASPDIQGCIKFPTDIL